ncbi:MAG: carboxymuconolactone decarboxylase family protein [Chloroflexi bacterium]|nr:carboxymuconolactone decarboxylase family protein [Chloroflexota bacterium]
MFFKETYEKGQARRRQMAAPAEPTFEMLREIAPDLDQILTGYLYGELYCRPQIDERTRRLLQVAMFASTERRSQTRSSLISALDGGITQEELVEIFYLMAFHVGPPTAVEGLKALKQVLDERKAANS